MDRTVKRDIQKRYKKMVERFNGNADEISCYVCVQCGQVTKVRQIDKGMSPGGIECPYCHGEAMMEMIDTFPNIPVTHEWYRPTLDDVMAMADEDKMFTVNYILNGGLIRRQCSQS